jgi:hypothetical protein
MIVALLINFLLSQPRPAELSAKPKAVDIVLSCVCSSRPDKSACKKERIEDVSEITADLLWETYKQRDKVPTSMRLILLAVACGESGLRSRPTCGGRPRCNDSGTSGGMFQIKLSMKKGSLRWTYNKARGKLLDVYDHVASSAFYLERLIWGVHNKVKRVCGWRGRSINSIWSIAAVRLGRGPILYKEYSDDGKVSKYVQRCSPTSRYAKTAVSWHRKCSDCWKLEEREHISTE